MRLHSGILYLAMLETANWTVFGLLHRVGLPKRTGPLETRRWVKAGDTVGISGRLVPATDAAARVRVEATDGTGTLVGILERDYELPGRQAFLEQMGYTELPPGLEDALPE